MGCEMRYTIMQSSEKIDKRWDLAKESLNLNSYSGIYKGVLKSNDPLYALEKLYLIFNMRIPIDYKGEPVGTGDLVKLDYDGESKYFYCNPFSWVNITDHLRNLFLRNT